MSIAGTAFEIEELFMDSPSMIKLLLFMLQCTWKLNCVRQKIKYTVIVKKGNESGYMAYAPALKGCVSQGKTKPEALRNIKEAMEADIEALLEDGLPVPTEVGKDTMELEGAVK